uniref:Up-frameshift suppressor 2 C-terminal domain-containing protein n=1 Tax=Ditylenchus dipsaci TaxID=166011 RepID=A0A915DEY6_9BILA
MSSNRKTAAKNISVVPDSAKSTADSTSSPPNESLNARLRPQKKDKLGGLNDRLAVYTERIRNLKTENARRLIQGCDSEQIEKNAVPVVEKQYKSKISQLRNEFEGINRDKAKLEIERSKTADACKDTRSTAQRLKMKVKASHRDRKGHCDIAEKEIKTVKKEEEECKKQSEKLSDEVIVDSEENVRVNTDHCILPEDEDFMRDLDRIMNETMQANQHGYYSLRFEGPMTDLEVPLLARQKLERKVTFATEPNPSPSMNIALMTRGKNNKTVLKRLIWNHRRTCMRFGVRIRSSEKRSARRRSASLWL